MTRIRCGYSQKVPFKRALRSEMTGAEQALWFRLRARQFQGLKFRRQHGIGPYIVDFYCAELAVALEIDGDTHADAKQAEYDRGRERYLQSLGVRVIRFQNADVLSNLDGVLESLRLSLDLP